MAAMTKTQNCDCYDTDVTAALLLSGFAAAGRKRSRSDASEEMRDEQNAIPRLR